MKHPHPLARIAAALNAHSFCVAAEVRLDSLRSDPDAHVRGIYLQCLALAEMGEWAMVLRRSRAHISDAGRELQALFVIALIHSGHAGHVLEQMDASDPDSEVEALRFLLRAGAHLSLDQVDQGIACAKAAAFISPSLIEAVLGLRRAAPAWRSLGAVMKFIRQLPLMASALEHPDVGSASAYSQGSGGITPAMRASLRVATESAPRVSRRSRS